MDEPLQQPFNAVSVAASLQAPPSISPLASLFLSWLAVSTGPLRLTFVGGHWNAASGSMASSHRRCDWHLGCGAVRMLSKGWDVWAPSLHLYSLLRIKDMSKAPHTGAPFHSSVLFCPLQHVSLSPICPRKIKQPREAGFHCESVFKTHWGLLEI